MWHGDCNGSEWHLGAPMTRALLLALTLFCTTAWMTGPAHALAPAQQTGPELPTPAPRLGPVHVTDTVPHAVADFLDHVGEGWTVVMDPRTQTAHRIYGPGLLLDHIPQTSAEALDAAWDVIEEWRGLLGPGIAPTDLSPRIVERRRGTWTIGFDRMTGDVPVEGAMVELRIRGDRVVLLSMDTFPSVSADTQPAIDPDTAERLASSTVSFGDATLTDQTRLVVVPIDDGEDLVGHLAWRVEMRTFDPPDWSVWYVDAHKGELIAREHRLRWSSVGVLEATVDLRNLDGTEVRPLPHLSVLGQQTAADGSIDVAGGVDTTVTLQGEHVLVRDASGAEHSQWVSLAADGDKALFTATGEDMSELDVFVYLNEARNRVVGLEYGNSWANWQVPVYVNINSSCNAYYDGESLNFYRSGGGCNNTGRMADVIYHEFGHGVHYTAIVSGAFEGAMGEGAADYLSATITNSPLIAPRFWTSGHALRDLSEHRSYPGDWVYEDHTDGIIYGGAMWDLREALVAKHGQGPGERLADVLFYATLEGSSGMLDAYGDALLAADSDGDISNGVEDGCEILTAFRAHGLAMGPTVFDAIEVDHVPLGNQTGDARHAIAADVKRGPCGGERVADVRAVVEYADGTRDEVALSHDGGSSWSGTIPAPDEPGLVHYAIIATDGISSVRVPADVGQQFAFYSGYLGEIYCQDFEGGWAGWTHGASSQDPAILGIDEWEIGRPVGLGGDPTLAPSGERVAGLDLGLAGDGDGFYEPDTTTWLRSPVVDVVGHEDVRLQWWSWVSVEDAAYDEAWIEINGERYWTNAAGAGDDDHLDKHWIFHDLEIDTTDSVQIRFALASDGGKEFGGWAIDQVCLVSPSTGDPGGNNGGGPGDGQGGQGRDGNAARIDGTPCADTGECDGGDAFDGKGGCGCSAAQSAPPWWLALGLIGWRQRRNRGENLRA
jgi:MYXO-CTERM domain-containing protein